MRKGKLVNVLGVILLTFPVLGLAGCGEKPEPSPRPDVLSSKSPNPIEESKQRYTDALKRAKAWQSNAELARVYRTFSGTLAPSSPTPLVYAFASLADPKGTFEVEFRGDKVVEQTKRKQPYELLFNPIDVSGWKIPPDEALRIAEEAGGEAFREKHLAGYSVLQQLAKTGAHPLQWYFRYDSGDDTRLRLEIYVNADTGGVDFQKQRSIL